MKTRQSFISQLIIKEVRIFPPRHERQSWQLLLIFPNLLISKCLTVAQWIVKCFWTYFTFPPVSFSFIFGVFKDYNFYSKCAKLSIYLSSIWCRDSNSRSIDCECPPMTTKSGSRPSLKCLTMSFKTATKRFLDQVKLDKLVIRRFLLGTTLMS